MNGPDPISVHTTMHQSMVRNGTWPILVCVQENTNTVVVPRTRKESGSLEREFLRRQKHLIETFVCTTEEAKRTVRLMPVREQINGDARKEQEEDHYADDRGFRKRLSY